MIFGRKKRQQTVDDEQVTDEELDTETDPTLHADELADDEAGLDAAEADDEPTTAGDQEAERVDDQADPADDDQADPADAKWVKLDASQDWREDGPFDIDEVDLDADDVERLDFGSLIITPFDGMGMQLQVNQQSGDVQAVLVAAGTSAIEIALFAAPGTRSMLPEIRRDMIKATEQSGGNVSLGKGPFGTEIRRLIPVKDQQGNDALHVSRTWFARGPKWLLRGVLMGEAAMNEGVDGPTELLYEFFSNTVVRRDSQPRVPGDLIPMTMPAGLQTA